MKKIQIPAIVLLIIQLFIFPGKGIAQITGGENTSQLIVKVWEIPMKYKPESAAYDSKRNCIYISNYTGGVKNGEMYGNHTITKAGLDGNIISDNFITGITTPTGICIFNDRLYIVERFGVVEFDLESDRVSNRYYIKGTGFINDITIGDDTSIYVSVSDSNIIYRIKGGKAEEWMNDTSIARTNGVLFDSGKIIAGCNVDNKLKEIDITTRKVKPIVELGPGIIDGIIKCGSGYLVSHYLGNLYYVSRTGYVTELLNTRDKMNVADFEYIPDKQLVIIPDLTNSRLFCYRINTALL